MGINEWGRVLVSIIVVVGFLSILVLVITTKVQGNSPSEVQLVMLGALATSFGQVISYWVGSSASSSAKDATISTMVNKS